MDFDETPKLAKRKKTFTKPLVPQRILEVRPYQQTSRVFLNTSTIPQDNCDFASLVSLRLSVLYSIHVFAQRRFGIIRPKADNIKSRTLVLLFLYFSSVCCTQLLHRDYVGMCQVSMVGSSQTHSFDYRECTRKQRLLSTMATELHYGDLRAQQHS